jgi:hypothetical protein
VLARLVGKDGRDSATIGNYRRTCALLPVGGSDKFLLVRLRKSGE